MKICIAIDSFKGSLTSLEAGHAVQEGICRVYPEAEIKVFPLADGGEGTVEALCAGLGGERISVEVHGPLGDKVNAVYGRKDNLAIMEMASASGLTLVPKEKRDGARASSYGVGEMIADALKQGCRDFLIGIGGSATSDGGIGMLQALGFEFFDDFGKKIPQGAGANSLSLVKNISDSHVIPELRKAEFRIASDVDNPLYGERGAVRVFGPQKGLKSEQLGILDAGMKNYAEISAKYAKRDFSLNKGAGAAGGLGFAFLTFLHGTIQSGIELVLDAIELDKFLLGTDIVITGEGRLDAQTVMGKAPGGVAKPAKKHGCKVIAFSGCVTQDATAVNREGIDAFFPILRTVTTLEEAMSKETARQNLADTAEQVFRLIKALK